MTAHVNDANFPTEVLDSQQPVLVDFWAPWCGPCKALAPLIDEIAKEYDGRLKVVKADVGQAPQAAAKYGVSSIPNVVVIDGGEVRAQLLGLRPKQDLVEAIQPWLSEPAKEASTPRKDTCFTRVDARFAVGGARR